MHAAASGDGTAFATILRLTSFQPPTASVSVQDGLLHLEGVTDATLLLTASTDFANAPGGAALGGTPPTWKLSAPARLSLQPGIAGLSCSYATLSATRCGSEASHYVSGLEVVTLDGMTSHATVA